MHIFNQVVGINYTETFPPVTKMVTMHSVLVVVSMKAWELHQMDVRNAFLHGGLHEGVFMKMPPVFQHHNQTQSTRFTNHTTG